MVDMLKSARDEDQRKRDEAQFYSIQQQLDELRRQLKENLARQQWFEELYKQNEGKVAQLQGAQDRLTQDVAQAFHTRQVEDGRIKGQLSELQIKVEAPEKQIRELRAYVQDLIEARKSDKDADVTYQNEIEQLSRQIRELHSHIGQVSDAQRQLRDLIQELDSKLGELRQESVHLSELQSLEEQRLRRSGVELQGLFESLRQQFNEVSAKSQRVDDVRRQLTERIEAIEELIALVRSGSGSVNMELERIERMVNEQYLAEQERLETVRVGLESQVGEMRQLNDQRMDRYMSRFTGVDDRLRQLEQMLAELPSRFEALERKDEIIGSEADTIEEWLVMRQLEALEGILEEVRKRRLERSPKMSNTSSVKPASAPGSVYNPQGLLKSVRDAKPPSRTSENVEE